MEKRSGVGRSDYRGVRTRGDSDYRLICCISTHSYIHNFLKNRVLIKITRNILHVCRRSSKIMHTNFRISRPIGAPPICRVFPWRPIVRRVTQFDSWLDNHIVVIGGERFIAPVCVNLRQRTFYLISPLIISWLSAFLLFCLHHCY